MPLDDAGILARAGELCAHGHCAEASELLRPVAEREPSNLDVWRLLARAELAAGRHDRALQAAEHTHVLAPADALADVIASAALWKLGRRGEALQRARRAVASDPQDAVAVSLLARMLSVAGLHDEARAAAADLAPDQPEAHLTVGVVAAAAGQRDAARASFREVLALDPANGAAHHELARLRLRRRVNDPAALADAASGFARAANADRDRQQSVRSLERVLRTFLSKTAYLLFIDAYLVSRVSASSNAAAARLAPVALLALPGYYAARFLRRLTPIPRQRLLWLLIEERALMVSTALEVIAVTAILVASVGADALRSSIAVVAAVAALAARLLLSLARERAARFASGQHAEHAIRASLIWVVAAMLGLLAVALLVAAAARGRPSAAVGALVCLAAAAALSRLAARRRVPAG